MTPSVNDLHLFPSLWAPSSLLPPVRNLWRASWHSPSWSAQGFHRDRLYSVTLDGTGATFTAGPVDARRCPHGLGCRPKSNGRRS